MHCAGGICMYMNIVYMYMYVHVHEAHSLVVWPSYPAAMGSSQLCTTVLSSYSVTIIGWLRLLRDDVIKSSASYKECLCPRNFLSYLGATFRRSLV